MKHLQLPKNKFALIIINFLFLILWARLIRFLFFPWGTVGEFLWKILEIDYFNDDNRLLYMKLLIWVQWGGFIGGSIYLWTKKSRSIRSKD